MKHSPELGKLFAALAKAQEEMTAAEKNTEGYGYKYAPAVVVWSVSRPSLARNGISVAQHVETDEEGRFTLETIVGHSSGEWMSSIVRMHIDPKFEKKNPQGIINIHAIGSAITYFRRYCYASATGVITEDDDGKAASEIAADVTNAVDENEYLTNEEIKSLDDAIDQLHPDLQKLVVELVKTTCNVKSFNQIQFKDLAKAMDIIKKAQ